MAGKTYSKEQLNFFKFCTLVFDEFPKVLRQLFENMWNSKVVVRPEFIVWDDSPTVRSMFLASEGGKTKIPTTKSIKEWDCTTLFKATIYAKTFGVPSGKSVSTLDDLYLKSSKPPEGHFRPDVKSPIGNQDETYALVIDQLRLLRNTLCHSPKQETVKSDFDNYVHLVKDALSAVNADTTFVDEIGKMSEDDFPTEKVQQLNECRMKELQAISMFHEDIAQNLSAIYGNTEQIKEMIGDISLGNKRHAPASEMPDVPAVSSAAQMEVVISESETERNGGSENRVENEEHESDGRPPERPETPSNSHEVSDPSASTDKMCSSCVSMGETRLPDDGNQWPINKIETACYEEVCKLLDLHDDLIGVSLLSALECFTHTEASSIKLKFSSRGGIGTAEFAVNRWGNQDCTHNVGAFKVIVKDKMKRSDVIHEIEKWELLSVCHGCGIKLKDNN